MGKYTYGIYLLHPIAILIVDLFYRLSRIDTNNFMSHLTKGIWAFPLTIAMSILSYMTLEKYFLNLKKRLSN
jgi:peptidoglycan/LPS O-acetylase OafA/YrhL